MPLSHLPIRSKPVAPDMQKNYTINYTVFLPVCNVSGRFIAKNIDFQPFFCYNSHLESFFGWMMNMRNSLVGCIVGMLSALSVVSTAANPQVTLHITGAVTGDIVIELYAEQAPITVENFIDYVQSGFYDGLIFHRVISGFMIQGGGYDTDLNDITPGDPIINESSNRLSNVRGTLAMARTTYADSATSQFFINLDDNTFLDYGWRTYDYQYNVTAQVGYCVFGEVISGMEIVDAIAAVNTTDDVPDNNVIIQSAVITLNTPVCAEKMPGDIDGDCDVDLGDLAKLTENWMACNSITASCG